MYDGDTMVGFTMYGTEHYEGHYWIARVMVDLQQQNKGYGRAAMVQVIERMKALPDCNEIYLDFNKQNVGAEHLYLSMGFEKVDENEHEYIARLRI
jgi:diamine N-acetyltransferase